MHDVDDNGSSDLPQLWATYGGCRGLMHDAPPSCTSQSLHVTLNHFVEEAGWASPHNVALACIILVLPLALPLRDSAWLQGLSY